MRKIILTTMLVLFYGVMMGQCITNGALNSTCSGDGFNGANCVSGWTASHGTPTVMGTVGSNTWAWLWSHSNGGEGIMTNYNFEAGRTYQVSFRVRATTNISNPNNTVLNSTLNVRAANGLTGSSSTTIPTPTSSQNIWSRTVAQVGSNWTTVTLNYSPNVNYSRLWFYPLMTANSSTNGSAQIQMEVDDIAVTPPVTSEFNFQNAGGTVKTDFCPGEAIFLNGTNSFGENQYYIDVWRRPIGSANAFQWQTQLGTNGWTAGQVGVLNLSNIFAAQNYTFAAGYEYQIKLATASTPCVTWVESTRTFRVLNNTASPAFTYVMSCAANGTISVTATALDTSAGISQWWALMETNTPGAISDTATIGQVGAIQSGNTVTFTGLSRTKSYYIKHGVYGTCVTWNEQRTALPQTVGWSNYTTNFNVAPSANLNGTVNVTVQAHNNPVFVYHHWSIFYAPNGSTAGNTNVPNNPDQCCNSATATFSNNLIVNEWYYIKHGIWNDCSGWGETRKAFRVVIQGLTAGGSPNYVIEEMVVSPEDPNILNKSSKNTFEVSALSPNPASSTDVVSFKTNTKEIESIQVVDFMNTTEKIKFNRVNDETIEFSLGTTHKSGIYIVKVIYKDQSVVTKKLVIQ